MGPFTFVPVWVIEDLLIYAATLAVVFYIIKREAHPAARLMEMAAFTLLDSVVYENFATVEGIYGYGRSLIMVANVPLSVPLFEYLVLYSALKIFEAMKMPTWLKPIGAGFLAVVADLTLDPVSVLQRFPTLEGTVSRWWWVLGDGWVHIYSEPVKNFTGWMAIIGWAAVTALLGRAWHRRSGYRAVIGYVYPILAAIGALILTVSPLSMMLLTGWPLFAKGSPAEWVTFGLCLIVPPILFAIFWRGKMRASLSFKADWPVFFVLGGFPVVSVLFTVLGGYWQILWLELLFTVVMGVILAVIYRAGRRADSSNTLEDPPRSAEMSPRPDADRGVPSGT